MNDFGETLSKIRQARSTLELLVERTHGDGARTAISFVRHIFAHLMRADGSLSPHELRLLAEFNRDGFTWTEEVEYARDTVEATPQFLQTVPGFLRAALRFDQQHGTEHGSKMVEVIGQICDLVVHCDGVAEVSEMQAMDTLLATCARALVPTDRL